MTKDTGLIKCVLIIAGVILVAAFFYITFPPYASPPSSSSKQALGTHSSFPPPNVSGAYIMTVFELQTALCDVGYGVKVDGVIGEETKTAWDAYCWNREAGKYMTLTGEPKEK